MTNGQRFFLRSEIPGSGARIEVELTDIGASLVECRVPDRTGELANVCLRLPQIEDYSANSSNFGAIVGRYANRIGGGEFELDGRSFSLERNNGPNHLHGASSNYAHRVWQAEADDNVVTFRLSSPDGDGGYPGRLEVTVRYQLTADTLTVDYHATTDAPTVVNLTNHAYWNLDGHDAGSVLDQHVQLNAGRVCVNDADTLPTGELRDVTGTPFDFRESHNVGRDWAAQPGFDNCFLIDGQNGAELVHAATLRSPASGRRLDVSTTYPGVQLYTANHLAGTGPVGDYVQHGGICLECQHLPDAPNKPNFPSAVLRPGETYHHRTAHRFSVT